MRCIGGTDIKNFKAYQKAINDLNYNDFVFIKITKDENWFELYYTEDYRFDINKFLDKGREYAKAVRYW